MRDPREGVDPLGYIVTGVRRDRIAGPFVAVIDAAIAAVESASRPSSLYVYGSVATGMARCPSSDVDLLVIGMDPDTADAIARRLSREFTERCRSVDIAVGQLEGLHGDTDSAYGNRAFLRHYCAHLCGPPAHAGLPAFLAGRQVARGFNGDLAEHARRWRSELEEGLDPANLARRIARKTLLAVSGLVSIHDATWTTDRLSAARRWSVLEPQWATALANLVRWSESSLLADVEEVRVSLDGVVTHVIDSFDATIGLWDTSSR
jgi:hypothetical protein